METVDRNSEAKKRIAKVAQAIVQQGHDMLEGSRQIVNLRAGLSLEAASDEDLTVFVSVESELDDIPGPSERQHWEKSAFADLDMQKAEYLETVKEEVVRAARALMCKWAG